MAGKAGMQLKRYWITRDRWDEYLAVWRRIAAIRQRAGFAIPFALADRENNVFTWAVSHPDFAEGAARYYADEERKSVSRTDYDPATGAYTDAPERAGQNNVEDFILKAEIDWVTEEPIPGT